MHFFAFTLINFRLLSDYQKHTIDTLQRFKVQNNKVFKIDYCKHIYFSYDRYINHNN